MLKKMNHSTPVDAAKHQPVRDDPGTIPPTPNPQPATGKL